MWSFADVYQCPHHELLKTMMDHAQHGVAGLQSAVRIREIWLFPTCFLYEKLSQVTTSFRHKTIHKSMKSVRSSQPNSRPYHFGSARPLVVDGPRFEAICTSCFILTVTLLKKKSTLARWHCDWRSHDNYHAHYRMETQSECFEDFTH